MPNVVDTYYSKLDLQTPPQFQFNDQARGELAYYLRKGKFQNPLWFVLQPENQRIYWEDLRINTRIPTPQLQRGIGDEELLNPRVAQNLLFGVVGQENARLLIDEVEARKSEGGIEVGGTLGDQLEQLREDNRGLPLGEDRSFALMVNPNIFGQNFQKNITNTMTRGGWRIAYNSQPQPVISAEGITPGFYTYWGLEETFGLTRTKRHWSGAWANLMDLVALFRNNGTIREESDPGVVRKVGDVVMIFEGWIWRGSFRTFSIRESATQPFFVSYNFEFQVREFAWIGWGQAEGVPECAPVQDAPDYLDSARTPRQVVSRGFQEIDREVTSDTIINLRFGEETAGTE